VVFVNDSTDETPTVIHALSEEERRISLIHRAIAEQDGDLSTAGATSMDAVVNESEYTCVMDADLQHPPQKVRELLEKARSTEADVVVASRYARGASYAGLPGPVRKAISAGSKYLTRIVFKEARKTSDPMTGFFLVRNETISGIQFRPTGFKILLEILVCAPELRVTEVPLNFLPGAQCQGLQGDSAAGLGVPGAHNQPLLVRPFGGAILEVRPRGSLGGAGQPAYPDNPRRVLRRHLNGGLDNRRRRQHPEQLPPQQRLHLARREALQPDPLPRARGARLPGSDNRTGSELRGLLPPGPKPRYRLPLLRDRRLPGDNRGHQLELYPELALRLPPPPRQKSSTPKPRQRQSPGRHRRS
jgi:hypothetical protein